MNMVKFLHKVVKSYNKAFFGHKSTLLKIVHIIHLLQGSSFICILVNIYNIGGKIWIKPFHRIEKVIGQSMEKDSVIGNQKAKRPSSSLQTVEFINCLYELRKKT